MSLDNYIKSDNGNYQGLTDSSSNIFLQSMMINAIGDGVAHYQAFTDATAGIVNQQFTKSQVQHRWSWEVLGKKALWILPITHTCLTLLLFGVFPLIIALTTLPGGLRILFGYMQFFMSLQLWPVLFAILNAGMTVYGASSSSSYGQFTMVNLDKIDELHADISGACGYLMMLIPFLSHGLVSNLGGAFSNLATSMMSHMQGSSMAVAGEAASGSFGLGQTSFYNTTANNLSANKHDSNWTNMHGMHTEQLGSGVLKTLTGSGDTVFDASPGMTKSPVHIADSKALTGSLNQAYEQSSQAAANASNNYQSALSNFSHRALALSQLSGHDMRLGEGISSSESAQYSSALSKMSRIAEDVAHRNGISKEDAFAAMTRGGHGISAGVDLQKSLAGKILGVKGGWDGHLNYERSSTNAYRSNEGYDKVVTVQEANDFSKASQSVEQFAKNHHFDDSHSEAASLSNQMGIDLRESENASHNYDVSHARAMRIANVKSYVESRSDQISTDLNQAFPAFVAAKVGQSHRDALFAHPGDLRALKELDGLASEFVQSKRDELIEEYREKEPSRAIDTFHQHETQGINQKSNSIISNFKQNSSSLIDGGKTISVGIDEAKKSDLMTQLNRQFEDIHNAHTTNLKIENSDDILKTKAKRMNEYETKEPDWKYDATTGVIPGHAVDKASKQIGLDKLPKLIKGEK